MIIKNRWKRKSSIFHVENGEIELVVNIFNWVIGYCFVYLLND